VPEPTLAQVQIDKTPESIEPDDHKWTSRLAKINPVLGAIGVVVIGLLALAGYEMYYAHHARVDIPSKYPVEESSPIASVNALADPCDDVIHRYSALDNGHKVGFENKEYVAYKDCWRKENGIGDKPEVDTGGKLFFHSLSLGVTSQEAANAMPAITQETYRQSSDRYGFYWIDQRACAYSSDKTKYSCVFMQAATNTPVYKEMMGTSTPNLLTLSLGGNTADSKVLGWDLMTGDYGAAGPKTTSDVIRQLRSSSWLVSLDRLGPPDIADDNSASWYFKREIVGLFVERKERGFVVQLSVDEDEPNTSVSGEEHRQASRGQANSLASAPLPTGDKSSVGSPLFTDDQFAKVKSALAQPQNGGFWQVVKMPEVQKRIKEVFGNDFSAFMDSTGGPGGVNIKDGFLQIGMCKAHDCGDHQVLMIINLKDSRGAGALASESSISVHLGDYDGPSSLPLPLQDHLKDWHLTQRFMGGSFVDREIHYER
jgi:hypothetical protein